MIKTKELLSVEAALPCSGLSILFWPRVGSVYHDDDNNSDNNKEDGNVAPLGRSAR